MSTQPTKTIFCANCQANEVHYLSASPSGELQAACSICGRVLKFASDTTPEDFTTLVDAQKSDNEGQVTVDSINAKLAEFADAPVVDAEVVK